MIDVAIGKPCIQSGFSRWSKEYGAGGAVRRLKNNEAFGFHTDKNSLPYWSLDLLWEYPIHSLVLHNRLGDDFIHLSQTLVVEISINNVDWIIVHSGLVFFGSDFDNTANAALTLPLASKIKARYVRLSLKDKQYFHLYKVQVYVEKRLVTRSETEALSVNVPETPFHIKPRLKAVVLGTSNSLLKGGYTSTLASGGVEVVRNMSLGSSHPTMVPYRLSQIDDLDFDVLIVDLGVNEQRAVYQKLYDLKLSSSIFEMLITWCVQRKVKLVKLLMPNTICIEANEIVNNSERSKVRSHYLSLCKKYGVAYFDGFEFVKDVAENWQRDESSLFKDTLHLNQHAAQVLGYSLSHSIYKAFETISMPDFLSGKAYFFYPLSDCVAHDKMIKRSTSLMSESIAQLSKGDKVSFVSKDATYLVGVVINMYQTNATLKITTLNSVTQKRLDNSEYSKDRNMAIVSWAMVTPIEIIDGKVELEVCKSITNDDSELNDHCKKAVVYNDEDTILEILGLVFEKNRRSSHKEVVELEQNLTSMSFKTPFTSNDVLHNAAL